MMRSHWRATQWEFRIPVCGLSNRCGVVNREVKLSTMPSHRASGDGCGFEQLVILSNEVVFLSKALPNYRDNRYHGRVPEMTLERPLTFSRLQCSSIDLKYP